MKPAVLFAWGLLLASGATACQKTSTTQGNSPAQPRALNAKPVADLSLCGPYPKLYKEDIWNWMQSNLVDPNSAKIEWEVNPQCSDVGQEGKPLYGWLVKFKVNARNRFGAYTGKQNHAVLIRDDKIVQTFGLGY